MKRYKGFVVSVILYPLLVLFLALLMGMISMTDTRKRILDRMKLEISTSIFNEEGCSCDTIIAKLNYIMEHIGDVKPGTPSGFTLNITSYETAAQLPVKANVNDIAILSNTPVISYQLTPYQPTTTIEGVVWIKSDPSVYYAFLQNEQNEGNMTIPLRVTYQYIHGEWVNIPSYIYTKSDGWKALFYSKDYTEYILNGADPELYDGLVPITIDASGNIKVADTNTEWYKYEDKRWANAVLVSNPSAYSAGSTIPKGDILMYFVWIPRYKYRLFNTGNASTSPLAIPITFESKTTAKSAGSTNGTWLTHPAFTFGSTELNGFWVAKFEMSGSTSNLRSIPGASSLRSITVNQMFTAARSIETSYGTLKSNQVDSHMMKNMEWGAMAYLSHSNYGTCTNGSCTEVTYNSNSSYYTGGSNNNTAWATSSTYTNQSTTLNRYGIYDTSGGSWEYVMGVITNSSGGWMAGSSGMSTAPDNKYVDYYAYSTSNSDHQRGKLGDATKETLQTFGSTTGGWYGDYSYFPESSYPWFVRGGSYGNGATSTGVFAFYRYTGQAYEAYSFRAVVSAE